jgi:hypothetical protein
VFYEEPMYVLQYRMPGAAIWASALPAPVQAVMGEAKVASDMLAAAEVRMQAADPLPEIATPGVDIRT